MILIMKIPPPDKAGCTETVLIILKKKEER